MFKKQDKLHQDNASAMKLERDGKVSSTKRTCHVDIRFFFICNRVKAKQVGAEHTPTGEMFGNVRTKPVQGLLFQRLRNSAMGVLAEECNACLNAHMLAEEKRRGSRAPNN